MGSKGSQQTTQNQSQSYVPAGLSYMQSALQQGQNAAQLPFNLSAAPVAGFSGQQQQAFNAVGNAQGSAQPYYDQAASYFSPQGAQQFFNPYAQNVMAGLSDIFGQQASQNTGQLTQAAGGVGADRIAVGQSELARQQGLAAGQTLAGLYGQSQQQAQQAGQNIQGLGSNVFNSQLQGANALLGVGGLQQQQQQQQLNSPYQLSLAQAAFPYQNAMFNAQITGALAPGMGGTTTGQSQTNQQFNPSMWGQIGGGIGALGSLAGYAFASRGGAINNPYASGGTVPNEPIDVSRGYVPAGKLPAGSAHMPSLSFSAPSAMKPPDTGLAKALQGGMSLYNSMSAPAWGGGNPFSGDAYGGSGANPLPGLSASDYGPGFAPGGAVRNPYAMFADGGDVDDDTRAAGLDMLRQQMIAKGYTPSAPDEPYRMPDPAAVDAWRNNTPAAPMAMAAEPPTRGMMAAPAPNSMSASPLPAAPPGSTNVEPAPEGKSLAGFLKSPYAALLAGSLDAMASGSLAHGVSTGLTAFQGQETAEQAARKLDLEAQQHQESMTQMTPYQTAQIEVANKKLEKDTSGTGVLGSDARQLIAESYLAGDKSALSGLGYGNVGSQNRAAVWGEISRLAKERNVSGSQLAALKADYQANAAGARTAATRGAGIDIAVDEAQRTFPLALAASDAVPRGQYVPWNKAVQAFQRGTSSPELARFVTANRAVISAYAQAMSRTGVPTVHAQQAAEELMSTATSPQAYRAVIGQMEMEMQAAKSAPDSVRQHIMERISGKAPAAAAPAAPAAGGFTGRTASGPGGAKLRETTSGQWVP